MARWMLAFALILQLATARAQGPLIEVAALGDLELNYADFSIDIESRCGADWFVLEGVYWKCVRPAPSGRLDVVDFGRLPEVLIGTGIMRRPVTGDRRFLVFNGRNAATVYGFDPVTLAVTALGSVPPGGSARIPPILADADGDGYPEYLLPGSAGSQDRLIRLPGAPGTAFEVVRTLPFQTLFAGQFDADPQSELATVQSPGVLRFHDANSLAQESYQPQGQYLDFGARAVVDDWDGDAVQEIAIRLSNGQVGLLDPNRSSLPTTANSPGCVGSPLAPVAWQSPSSRDLALVCSGTAYVVDPRTGALLQQSPLPQSVGDFPQQPIARDWDNDGDMDLAWVQFGPNALWLFSNGGAVSTVQLAARNKTVVGYTQTGGPVQLVMVEAYGTAVAPTLRLRRRNETTLALVADAPLAAIGTFDVGYALADLHPQTGDEVLQSAEKSMTLHALDGSLLWTRTIDDPVTRSFRHAVVPDATCANPHCQRLLVLDAGSPQSFLRLYDTAQANGEIWSRDVSSEAVQAIVGLSDLDADGIPELLYSRFAMGTGRELVALDGQTRELHWRQAGIEGGARLMRRTPDPRERLAILGYSGGLHYLAPGTGELLRVRDLIDGNCDAGCELGYVRQGEYAGQWVAVIGQERITTLARSLRGAQWDGTPVLRPRSLAVSPSGMVHLTSGTHLHAFEAGAETLHDDEFEAW